MTKDNTVEGTVTSITVPAQRMAGLIGAPRPIDMHAVSLILALAPMWKESAWFGVKSAEQAMIVMAKAYELGFGLTTAFDFLYVIQTSQATRIVLSPKGALALIYRSGLLDKMEIKEKKGECYVYMSRKDNGYGFGLTFTIDQAKAAGLVKKGGAWESYEANMLRWRAIGFCSDIVFPDVKGGLQMADEFDTAVTVDGSVINE